MINHENNFKNLDAEEADMLQQIPSKQDQRSLKSINYGTRYGYLPPRELEELLADVELLNTLTDAEIKKIKKIIANEDYC